MMPITHGYYVAEESRDGARPQTPQSNKVECDKVVVQREQVEEQEWWFCGVFDTRIGGGVTKYLQAHLFDNNLNEVINMIVGYYVPQCSCCLFCHLGKQSMKNKVCF